jgi:hypothetical protein
LITQKKSTCHVMPRNVHKSLREASFTLVETMIALGIMSTVILQISGVQSNAVFFGDFARKSNQAIWLAKRVLSQVEYYWSNREFSELKAEEDNAKFEGLEEIDELKEFNYRLTIAEWKLPLINLLTGGAGGEEGDSAGGGGDMIASAIKNVLGEELLKVAHVEVSWPEGSRRNSETLTLLLTNQRKLDTVIGEYKAEYDRLKGGSAPTPNPSGGPIPSPTPIPSPSPT